MDLQEKLAILADAANMMRRARVPDPVENVRAVVWVTPRALEFVTAIRQMAVVFRC